LVLRQNRALMVRASYSCGTNAAPRNPSRVSKPTIEARSTLNLSLELRRKSSLRVRFNRNESMKKPAGVLVAKAGVPGRRFPTHAATDMLSAGLFAVCTQRRRATERRWLHQRSVEQKGPRSERGRGFADRDFTSKATVAASFPNPRGDWMLKAPPMPVHNLQQQHAREECIPPEVGFFSEFRANEAPLKGMSGRPKA